MRKIYLTGLFILLCGGCAVLEQLTKNPEAIKKVGEAAGEAGSTVALFNPQIGLAIIVGGGLLLAVAKALKSVKE
ncbi:hypothetical protein LCGC14_0420920 [marine sediment metagenome]|uniref:Uncharacterized protein n=1 Tax=marine sediment metagenome TaxID=412755 RepID=A0A0F9SQR1_9ZZZZ